MAFGITYHSTFLRVEFTDYPVFSTTGLIERWKERRKRASQLLSWLQLAGEAEVCKLDVHVIVQEDVLSLQIPMHDVESVQGGDHLQQGSHDLPGVAQAHVTLICYSARSGNRQGDQSP